MSKTLRRARFGAAVAACALFAAPIAYAQLEIFSDYDVSDSIWELTTVKVEPTQIDYYLEGIQSTWAEANDIAKELGHIEDYMILGSQMNASGDFNLILAIKYADTSDLAPSKARYDAFMKKWGERREEQSRETAKTYPAQREITGQYMMREITFK